MKRAKSRLIDIFLSHVKSGLISGRDDSSGPEVLQEMVTTLQDILNGEDTDKALHIERLPGKPPDVETIKRAILIHQQRKAGEKWSVVELVVNSWLKSEGREPLSLERMRAIYKQHGGWLRQRDDIEEMVKMVQQDIQQRR